MVLTDPSLLGSAGSEKATESASKVSGQANGKSYNGAGAATEAGIMAPEVTTISVFEPSGAELGAYITDTATVEMVGAPPVPLPPTPTPIPPIPILRRAVSGRYRGALGMFQVELRVDVDRSARVMHRVSADYYTVTGGTVNYFGSMRLDTPRISMTPTLVTITGLAAYTWSAGAPRIEVTIPRALVYAPPSAATLKHFTLTGTPGAVYVCAFESGYFRTVEIEQDRQDNVPVPFSTYNTGALPSGGPARDLTVAAAYAEAGIEMRTAGVSDVINTVEAGPGSAWTNAELHAAMERHFRLWRDIPQWKVWLFHAGTYMETGVLGIMFDHYDLHQRQGCAAFYHDRYHDISSHTPINLREQLYVCVHELGHCFNLLHSFQKQLATPPARPAPEYWALSYMNYPQNYRAKPPSTEAGSDAFWKAFPFQFDELELIHLRHAFRNNIIMGGNPFGVGAALSDGNEWQPPIQDESGLTLKLEGPTAFRFGEPISIQIKLGTTDLRGKRVSPYLKPSYGMVHIGIEQPSKQVRVYQPMITKCAGESTVKLEAGKMEISDSAFISYGKDGFYFDSPGLYKIRALYTALDGSQVMSNVLSIRVRSPLNAQDEEVGELLLGDEQGKLFYLVGSDYEGLRKGNDALETIIEQHKSHPLAAYAQLVKGINAARDFKMYDPAKESKLTVRRSNHQEANRLLKPVLNVGQAQQASRNDFTALRRENLNTLVSGSLTAPAAPTGLAGYMAARSVTIGDSLSKLSESGKHEPNR